MRQVGPMTFPSPEELKAMGWKVGTRSENWLALQLFNWGWKPPEVEQQFTTDHARFDFAVPVLGLAFEADGYVHDQDVRVKDAVRDLKVAGDGGWIVLRIEAVADVWAGVHLAALNRLLVKFPTQEEKWLALRDSRILFATQHGHAGKELWSNLKNLIVSFRPWLGEATDEDAMTDEEFRNFQIMKGESYQRWLTMSPEEYRSLQPPEAPQPRAH